MWHAPLKSIRVSIFLSIFFSFSSPLFADESQVVFTRITDSFKKQEFEETLFWTKRALSPKRPLSLSQYERHKAFLYQVLAQQHLGNVQESIQLLSHSPPMSKLGFIPCIYQLLTVRSYLMGSEATAANLSLQRLNTLVKKLKIAPDLDWLKPQIALLNAQTFLQQGKILKSKIEFEKILFPSVAFEPGLNENWSDHFPFGILGFSQLPWQKQVIGLQIALFPVHLRFSQAPAKLPEATSIQWIEEALNDLELGWTQFFKSDYQGSNKDPMSLYLEKTTIQLWEKTWALMTNFAQKPPSDIKSNSTRTLEQELRYQKELSELLMKTVQSKKSKFKLKKEELLQKQPLPPLKDFLEKL